MQWFVHILRYTLHPTNMQWFVHILRYTLHLTNMQWFIHILKLPSLFAAWLFWTFHNKSHNMKALVILSHSRSPFLPLTSLYGKNVFCGSSGRLFWEKNSLKITHANHMTMTTSRQIWSWPDYCKTKENVNIKLFVYILLSTCQWVHIG